MCWESVSEQISDFRNNVLCYGKLGDIKKITIDRFDGMQIYTTEGTFRLTSCLCGYSGDSPRGSIEVLEMLGIKKNDDRGHELERKILTQKKVVIKC